MFTRTSWIHRLNSGWQRRSILWLMGVRRVGKTVLAQSIPGSRYHDCELPHTRRLLDDPQAFLEEARGQAIVFDEIHRLANPAELLKIAADHFPDTRVLATGSSTLAASSRFRDTLTGRKEEIWLTPMTLDDMADFGRRDLRHRLLRGGLPPFFLADHHPEREYQEWADAYWAKDVLELFRLERRAGFQRLLELLMIQSGGIFEATRFSRACEISRPTVMNYLGVLEATFVVHPVRPFTGGRRAEILAAPRVYGFDTGLVCFYRGWHELRPEDRGILWEHLVLNELHARIGRDPIRYWRTKHGAEVDFVLVRRGEPPVVVECKWSADQFEPAGARAFRAAYPEGPTFVVSSDVETPHTRTVGGVSVTFTSLAGLLERVAPPQ